MSGHVEGNLNIVATRRGWSRNFTLAPDVVPSIDYATLENLLELNTIKLRATRLRIFVEHPAGSNTFVLLRTWKKDDNSLQASLVKAFFAERLAGGLTTVLDIRDEEQVPVVPERAREWIKSHTLPLPLPLPLGSRTPSAISPATDNAPEAEDGASELAAPATPAPASSTAAPQTNAMGGSFFGFFRAGPPAPPPKDVSMQPAAPPSPPPSDLEAEMKKEEDVLRERGWKPVLRRLTTRRRKKDVPSVVMQDTTDIMEEGDGEQIEVPDAREMSADAMATPEKQSIFKKGGSAFLGRKKSRKDVKGKGKAVSEVEAPVEAIESTAADETTEMPAEEESTVA